MASKKELKTEVEALRQEVQDLRKAIELLEQRPQPVVVPRINDDFIYPWDDRNKVWCTDSITIPLPRPLSEVI